MSDNRYRPPSATVADYASTELEYVGFWLRVAAALIDTGLIMAVTFPLLLAIYGMAYLDADGLAGPADLAISWLLPAAASIVFWLTRQATPGKMVVSAKVVDARSGGKISMGQAIGRYLGYFVSLLPLGVGILWVAFDRKKQGWHDKLARTVVVRPRRSGAESARFDTV